MESVYMRFTVGGSISRRAVKELRELARDLDNGAPVDAAFIIDVALEAGRHACFTGEAKFGRHEGLEAFCIAHQLSFQTSCEGASPTARHWSPGMAKASELPCDEDGEPVVSLTALKLIHRPNLGQDQLGSLILALETATTEAVPPLELKAKRTHKEKTAPSKIDVAIVE